MARRLSLLAHPSVRIGLTAATIASLVAGGSAAVGSQHAAARPANDIGWMATEHGAPTAPPYFDSPRNLNLDHTPQAKCGPGSRPETSWQGRVPAKDYADAHAAKGYTCNATEVSHFGDSGGYRVARYVDKHGHVCAGYDSTLLLGIDVAKNNGKTGVFALDMTNPRKPVFTANLNTPAMNTPHESLRLNSKRGLPVSDAGSPAK